MNLKDTMTWLIMNKYVTLHKNKPVFTDKARSEMAAVGKPPPPPSLEIPEKVVQTPAIQGSTIEEQYKQFIALCQIPQKAYDSFGRAYALNKYSNEGVLAFKKAIQKGYKIDVMALAVTLYYKSNMQFKKSVGNYMSSGEWETDYDTVLQKHQDGTLKEHIKTEVHDSTISWFTRG